MNLQEIQLIENAVMIIKSEVRDISKSFKEHFRATDDLNIDRLFPFCQVPSNYILMIFKRNAAMERSIDYFTIHEGRFCKFFVDNTNPNTCNLEGRNSFNDMAIIVSITDENSTTKKIPLRKILDEEILQKSHIPILHSFTNSLS